MEQLLAGRARTVEEFGALARSVFVPEEVGAALANWSPRPSDVLISPYSKCGTTWLQQIVHTLRTRGDMDFDDISAVVPWLETATLLGIDLNAEQKANPRAYKSHLPYEAIPHGPKSICSLREPKDTLVSMYHFMEGWFIEPGSISLGDFARDWMKRVERGSDIWRHLLSWWEQRKNPQVLLLTYEGMSANPERTILRVADFIGIELDEALLSLTLQRSSLGFMLSHKDKFAEPLMRRATEVRCGLPLESDAAKVRQGGSGSGVTELPNDVVVQLDELWDRLVQLVTGLRDYAALEVTLR